MIGLRFALALLTAAPLLAQDFATLTAQVAKLELFGHLIDRPNNQSIPSEELFEKWRKSGSVAELLAATRHQQPVVRCYAVRALVANDADIDYGKLLQERLDDYDIVIEAAGSLCKQKVGDIVYESLRHKLTDDARHAIAEQLIRGKSPLYARQHVLRTLRLRDYMLHEVRELAKAGDKPAIVALARYRLPIDLPLVKNLIDTEQQPFDYPEAMLAATAFADESLLAPLLRHEQAARRWMQYRTAVRLRHWFTAIAAQRSKQAATFLTDFFDDAAEDEGKRLKKLQWAYKCALRPQQDCAHFAALWKRLR